MNDLLETAIKAHGGLQWWNELGDVSARLVQGGALWALKGQAGILADVLVTASLHTVEHTSAGVLRGNRDMDLPDSAVHVRDARVRDLGGRAMGRSRPALAAAPRHLAEPPRDPQHRTDAVLRRRRSAGPPRLRRRRVPAAPARRTTSPTTSTSQVSGFRPGTGFFRVPRGSVAGRASPRLDRCQRCRVHPTDGSSGALRADIGSVTPAARPAGAVPAVAATQAARWPRR
jgi:hypothetical protein